MAAEDDVYSLPHLGDVTRGAGVQGLLDDRLFGARKSAEGPLVAAQARVDLSEAVGAPARIAMKAS
ncbi:MAG TPA: hypothetical protein VGX48_21710 [Pyrinomonadaceae bacterium]|nr:hypothetical protein [Pyrinomonadaceae bacterium]